MTQQRSTMRAYRVEVRDRAMWCQDNNLSLNVIKTKEMIVDYRKKRTEHAPIEQVESFKFKLVSTSPTN